MAARDAAPGGRVEWPKSAELSFMAASPELRSDAETLALALRQATTCLAGLGALVHRRGSAGGPLRLAAASGLDQQSIEAWRDLRSDQDVAPASAVRHGAFVWMASDSLG